MARLSTFPVRVAAKSRSASGMAIGLNGDGFGLSSSDPAFPPLAAGELVIAGGVQDCADDALDELVEDEQVGFELADFVDDVLVSASVAFEQGAAGPVDSGGRVSFVAGADIFADDPAVDLAGAGVIAFAVGSGFPGHGGFGSDVIERGVSLRQKCETCGRGRTPG